MILIISIHAPREGSDCRILALTFFLRYFYPRSPRGERHNNNTAKTIAQISIHAPREGSDWNGTAEQKKEQLFLSTLPARGATPMATTSQGIRSHFYPRSPRGERRGRPAQRGLPLLISIHAPREGSDSETSAAISAASRFLSTLPARGATWYICC